LTRAVEQFKCRLLDELIEAAQKLIGGALVPVVANCSGSASRD